MDSQADRKVCQCDKNQLVNTLSLRFSGGGRDNAQNSQQVCSVLWLREAAAAWGKCFLFPDCVCDTFIDSVIITTVCLGAFGKISSHKSQNSNSHSLDL